MKLVEHGRARWSSNTTRRPKVLPYFFHFSTNSSQTTVTDMTLLRSILLLLLLISLARFSSSACSTALILLGPGGQNVNPNACTGQVNLVSPRFTSTGVVLRGAGGGANCARNSSGGNGGQASGRIFVSPSRDAIRLFLGTAGSINGPGGFNGGGDASGCAGGGGGATDIRVFGSALSQRIFVAGGGGGGGNPSGSKGGDGNILVVGNSLSNTFGFPGQISGVNSCAGGGGTNISSGSSCMAGGGLGGAGFGGNSLVSAVTGLAGGAGGGGFFGGSSGADGGGGGGSSFFHPDFVSPTGAGGFNTIQPSETNGSATFVINRLNTDINFLGRFPGNATQCNDWTTFRTGLPSTDIYGFVFSGSSDIAGKSCLTNPVFAQNLANAIRLGGAATTSGICDGVNFTYCPTCNGGELTASTQVNVCSTSGGYSLRPCIANPLNFGGVNSATCSGPSQIIQLVFLRSFFEGTYAVTQNNLDECDSWNSFVRDLPPSTSAVNGVVVSTVENSVSEFCNTPSFATALRDAILGNANFSSTCPSTSKPWIYCTTCGGEIQIGTSSLAQCCQCPSGSGARVFRPCIRNQNFGGFGMDTCNSQNPVVPRTNQTFRVRFFFGSDILPSPTAVPTAAPTANPTAIPTANPSREPTAQPSVSPTAIPTLAPTPKPTSTPTVPPTSVPTSLPTVGPTSLPTTFPTSIPTVAPSIGPTTLPSPLPTASPSSSPTARPSSQPSVFPTSIPTVAPSDGPTTLPTKIPTSVPTVSPSIGPTTRPTAFPTHVPTIAPSIGSTSLPSAFPTETPTMLPSSSPTSVPKSSPSLSPSPDSATGGPGLGPSLSPLQVITFPPFKPTSSSVFSTPSSTSKSTMENSSNQGIQDENNPISGNMLYAIIGGAVGLCIICTLLIVLVVCCVARRRKGRRHPASRVSSGNSLRGRLRGSSKSGSHRTSLTNMSGSVPSSSMKNPLTDGGGGGGGRDRGDRLRPNDKLARSSGGHTPITSTVSSSTLAGTLADKSDSPYGFLPILSDSGRAPGIGRADTGLTNRTESTYLSPANKLNTSNAWNDEDPSYGALTLLRPSLSRSSTNYASIPGNSQAKSNVLTSQPSYPVLIQRAPSAMTLVGAQGQGVMVGGGGGGGGVAVANRPYLPKASQNNNIINNNSNNIYMAPNVGNNNNNNQGNRRMPPLSSADSTYALLSFGGDADQYYSSVPHKHSQEYEKSDIQFDDGM